MKFFQITPGDRGSAIGHEDVILPKHVTDNFYAKLTTCYEELFQASFTPKYTLKSEKRVSPTNYTPRAPEYLTETLASEQVVMRRKTNAARKPIDKTLRYSLDCATHLAKNNMDPLPESGRKMSEPSPIKSEDLRHLQKHAMKPMRRTTSTSSWIFNPFSSRKKVYRLSQS